CTIWIIAHKQIRSFTFDTKIQNSYDVGMFKTSNCACFGAELFHIIAGQLSVQYFNCSLRIQMKVFSQVYFGEPSLSQQPYDAIVAKLLSHAINHTRTSSPLQQIRLYRKVGKIAGNLCRDVLSFSKYTLTAGI